MYPRQYDSDGADRRLRHLRQCLAPEFAELDSEALEAYMDERFGEGAAEHYDEYLESFLGDIGRTLSKAAPVIANVAGGVAKGAMSGSALGLPGIIGGAVMGGAGTALSSYAKGPLRNVGNVLNTGTQIASQFSPMGQIGNQVGNVVSGLGRGRITPRRLLNQGSQVIGALGGSHPALAGAGRLMGAAGSLAGGGGIGGAAGQLTSMLGRPEVQQALMAMNLGPAGRRTVRVGSARTPVPTAAIAGMLQTLIGQSIDEAAAFDEGAESALGYMADASGEFVGDPAEENDRSFRVMDLLNNANFERLAAAALQSAPSVSPAASQAITQAAAQVQAFLQQQQQQQQPRRPKLRLRRPPPSEAYDAGHEAFDEAAGYDEFDEYDEGAEYSAYGEYDEYDESDEQAEAAEIAEYDGEHDGEAWDESSAHDESAEWDEEIQYVYG